MISQMTPLMSRGIPLYTSGQRVGKYRAMMERGPKKTSLLISKRTKIKLKNKIQGKMSSKYGKMLVLSYFSVFVKGFIYVLLYLV